MYDQFQTIQRVSLKAIIKEKEFWILVFLGILYFHRPLFLGETFFFRDLYRLFLTRQQFFANSIHAGEFPLWNPYLHGGLPYMGNIINSALYPFTLLYLVFPLIKAFNLNIVLHVILCAVSAYLFSRIIGLRPISSLIAGVVYGFCGYTLSLVNLLAAFFNMPYLPLLFLFWHLFLLEGKRKWFLMSILAGVFQALTGTPSINAISMLSLLGWSLFYPYPHRSILRRILLWLFLGIFIVGIALLQIVPMTEMLAHSFRLKLSYTVFSSWSLHPKRLPELIFPGFLGYVDTLPWTVHYWGGNLVDDWNPLILSIYFGSISLVLAFIGGIRRRKDRVFPFRIRIFLLALFMISLFFTFGRFLPFFHLVYHYVPFITFFRYPIKCLIAGIFPLALLTGYTSEIHFSQKSLSLQHSQDSKIPEQHNVFWVPSSKMLAAFWGIATILLAITTMFWLSNDFANNFQEFFFKQSGAEVARHSLKFSFLHAFSIWLLVTLLYQYRRLKRRAWQHWLLACILIIDLFAAGKRVNPTAPEQLFTDVPPVVWIVRQEISDGRLFRTKDPSNLVLWVPDNILHIPRNRIVWGYRWNIETLHSRLASRYNIPVIFHSDPDRFSTVHLKKFKTLITNSSWEQRISLLSASNVTLILTHHKLQIPGIQRIAEIPNWSNIPLYLYKNTMTAARVEFVTDCKMINSDREAMESMLLPKYDPRHTVILHPPENQNFLSFFSMKQTQKNFTACGGLTPVYNAGSNTSQCETHITRSHSNIQSSLLVVSNTCDGYLVFSEPFYPGWHVNVDGKPAPILRANVAFSTIFLPAGKHEVKRFYRPTSVILGGIGSLCFFSLLLLITYKGWLMKPNNGE
ncbi:MAG: YfhO family protein [Deltaproteobacteria bacterium]|nr:YfhO family protein [Deltaproteobacteria bacterium]